VYINIHTIKLKHLIFFKQTKQNFCLLNRQKVKNNWLPSKFNC